MDVFPWVFQKFALLQLKLVLTNVQGSVVYTRKVKAGRRAAAPKPAAEPKAGGKGKGRGRPGSTPMTLCATVVTVNVDGQVVRQNMWLDDVLSAIESAFTSASGPVPEKAKLVSMLVSDALEVC